MKLTDIKTILVAGAGTMGQQTAILAAISGYRVVMYDISDEILAKGVEGIRKNGDRMVRVGVCTSDACSLALEQITTTSDIKAAAVDADLVMESIPEDPELKGKFFGAINDHCKPETIFTTNTSSLVPSMFADRSGRPDKLCALHFHDVTLSKIVDVMPHPGTSSQTMDLVKAFAESMGQIPIVLARENNGYVFNNMLMSFIGSALSLAAKGVTSIQEIDRSWMGVMHTSVGPFGIMDSIGLDTCWKVTSYWANKRNDTQAKANAAFLKGYLDKNMYGIKTGQGFYTYPDPIFSRPDFMTM
ncbi:putative 3-hydroxyacyl-CoA dehydrogenase [Desulforapulum autotrophicum HRM2]|uniref:3-hydroxyacyl-CoA dehydrogenase n=1 Tax=Desulforapulum autotrophicum (strain ATCC 43914 / DSM 3382 / VKM B-1955 / HRM2) TaxID=177437 RepID=C0QGF1_DESAH|nr:3-hydroxyacyl-CoA dehydrogenase [Desulforapulum autotrophicum]ACN13426.1 putative 3-hydroxyacyl-CoA dehydrogenase [Desulforapulum autotrophicum HRM2]